MALLVVLIEEAKALCLIEDEDYTPDIEDVSADVKEVCNTVKMPGLPLFYKGEFLQRAQNYLHDSICDSVNFRKILLINAERFAEEYNLDTNFMESMKRPCTGFNGRNEI